MPADSLPSSPLAHIYPCQSTVTSYQYSTCMGWFSFCVGDDVQPRLACTQKTTYWLTQLKVQGQSWLQAPPSGASEGTSRLCSDLFALLSPGVDFTPGNCDGGSSFQASHLHEIQGKKVYLSHKLQQTSVFTSLAPNEFCTISERITVAREVKYSGRIKLGATGCVVNLFTW